jgi:hypothetical protein
MWLQIDNLIPQILNSQKTNPSAIPALREQGLQLLAQIKQLMDADLLSERNLTRIAEDYDSVYHFFSVLSTL